MSQYLSDNDGNKSAMRVMCLIALIASILFGWLAIELNSDIGKYVTFGFLLGAFAPKAVQKYVEGLK